MRAATHVVVEVDHGLVLGGPAEDFTHFPETSEMLLDHVLLVEAWRDVPDHDGGQIAGRHSAQAVHAVPAGPTAHRG